VKAIVGETILQTAHRNEIELEGACEGGMCWELLWLLQVIYFITANHIFNLFIFCHSLNSSVCACSTCHVIFPLDIYDKLPEPSEAEEDMLDMAFGLTETSRLGCQITITEDMDGLVLQMPKATRNFYVDGHKPRPH
jgi:ferredoxin